MRAGQQGLKALVQLVCTY